MTPYPDAVLVVSHTHWDREWYKSAEAFRTSLLALVDDLLERDDDIPFLLDGQAIVLDDYLDWKPERRADLARRLSGGQLEAGPWYVLADNLIPGGEALVRNLLAGKASLRFLRADSPPVLYCPDSFGHPSAAPILANGFGLSLAIVWRGYGGRLWPAGDTVRWRHPSGSEVLLYHLPPSGYEFGASLPVDDAGAAARWSEIERGCGARSNTGLVLLLNGADHHARQGDVAAAVRALGRAATPTKVSSASLGDFSEALLTRTSHQRLGEVTGELRASPDYTWSLQGTFGVRSRLKRANAGVERLMLRQVEPWLALGGWKGRASHANALRGLWRMVLASHPHDTLCGCSTDDVALAMDERLRSAHNGAIQLRYHALRSLVGHEGGSSDVVVITNPAPRARGGVVEISLDEVVARVPVGPGSAVDAPTFDAPVAKRPKGFQLLGTERVFVRDENPLRYPRNYLVERRRGLVWIPEIPGFGLARYQPTAPSKPRHSSAGSSAFRGGIRNECYDVWLDEQRRLCLKNRTRSLIDFVYFESQGERGDLYTHSAIPDTLRRSAIARSRITMRGPLRAGILSTHRVELAERSVTMATGEKVRRRRETMTLNTELQLDAGRNWLRVKISGQNTAADHRLRLIVETGVQGGIHIADCAFGRVKRSSLATPGLPDDLETIPRGGPLHRYVTLVDQATGSGATIFSDGLAEYEAMEDGRVAITLLRSVGDLSRNDLPERPGHAGWPVSTPLAQNPGPFEAHIAVMLHGSLTIDTIDAIEHAADDFLVPLSGETLPYQALSELDSTELTLSGRSLRFECCKEAEDGSGAVVVRCTNLAASTSKGTWSLPGVKHAHLCRLDETPLGALRVQGGSVEFEAQPFAVVSIRLLR